MEREQELEQLQQQNARLRQHNTELNEAIERLRALFDSLPIGIYRMAPNGSILMANTAVLQLFGFTPDTSATTLEEALVAHQVGCARETFRRELETRGEVRGHEGEIYTDDGRAVLVRENARVVRGPDGTPLYYECTLEDVTERRKVEAALRASEERYRSVVEYSPAGILLIDDEATIVFANEETCNVFGRAGEEIEGRPLTDFLHPDDRDVIRNRSLRRREGDEAQPRYEVRVVRPDGDVRTLALSATTYRDPSGTMRAIAQFIDITERTASEQALREYATELEVRNAELDAFVDSVAHDLRNPLGTIIGFAEALLEPYDDLSREEWRSIIGRIARVGRQMDRIIEELLLFARVRKAAFVPQPVDMAPLIENVRHRLAQLIEDRDARFVVPQSWPLALGYDAWIEEIWANYISNALIHGGSPPLIELGADRLPNNRIRFWVKDNGPGIPEEHQDHIFEGFTQPDWGRPHGHGLGLAIVKRIIDKLDGETGVVSPVEGDRGSLFSFTLPAAANADRSQDAESGQPAVEHPSPDLVAPGDADDGV